jgi:hypothetical protein
VQLFKHKYFTNLIQPTGTFFILLFRTKVPSAKPMVRISERKAKEKSNFNQILFCFAPTLLYLCIPITKEKPNEPKRENTPDGALP